MAPSSSAASSESDIKIIDEKLPVVPSSVESSVVSSSTDSVITDIFDIVAILVFLCGLFTLIVSAMAVSSESKTSESLSVEISTHSSVNSSDSLSDSTSSIEPDS